MSYVPLEPDVVEILKRLEAVLDRLEKLVTRSLGGQDVSWFFIGNDDWRSGGSRLRIRWIDDGRIWDGRFRLRHLEIPLDTPENFHLQLIHERVKGTVMKAILSKLDVTLSTRASESTLSGIKTQVDKLTFDSNNYLYVNLGNDSVGLARDSTLQSIYSKLDALDNALDSVGTDKFRVTISAVTKIVEQPNYSLSAGGTLTLINYSGKGRLHEVTVISSSPNFKITIAVDGATIWDKSYSDASNLTDELVFVSAFQREDGKYVYHLSDIPFMSNLKVDIVNLDTANAITLDYVFAKYEAG